MTAPIPSQSQFAAQLLKTALIYVGIDRQTDPQQIGKFLGLFGLPFEEGGVNVPFCAAGVSWCACHAYADLVGQVYTAQTAPLVFHALRPEVDGHYFLTSPSCGEIMRDAQRRESWISNENSDRVDVLPGWLVLYDWDGQGAPDHVEIVQDAGDVLTTVGFNTAGEINGDQVNGGAVVVKHRTYDYVLGFVRI